MKRRSGLAPCFSAKWLVIDLEADMPFRQPIEYLENDSNGIIGMVEKALIN
jgi:hypothetical protein